MSIRKNSSDNLVYVVTTECPGVTASGGIGSQVLELSKTLTKSGVEHRILLIASEEHREKAANIENLEIVSASTYTDAGDGPKGVSFAAFKYLSEIKPKKIIFPDYLGIGFHSMLAKHQGLAFKNTELMIAVHGPTRWALEQNHAFFSESGQLAVDWMEMQSLLYADTIVYLSAYIKSWCENAWPELKLHPRARLACNPISFSEASSRAQKNGAGRRRINRIVLFGRHEYRKNILDFITAIKIGCKESPDLFQDLSISFLGAFAEVDKTPSELLIYESFKDLPLNVSFMPDCGRTEAMELLKSWPDCLVIIPSVENCPYTVLETLGAGLPVVVNGNGGSKELIEGQYHDACVFVGGAQDLSSKIQRALRHGTKLPKASSFVRNAPADWKSLCAAKFVREPVSARQLQPKVSLVIATYNRPEKAIEAVKSGLQQTYVNLEIVLVDDGSDTSNPAHKIMVDFAKEHGVRYVYQQNSYLGAARNTGARASEGDFVIHLDDDDLLLPKAVETLVSAAVTGDLDVVVACSYYMNEHERPILENIAPTLGKPAYLPLGGPLSLAFVENCIGPAVSLIARSVFDRVQYTELHGVGHEDYEFYINVLQSGFKLQVCPIPVFLYEVGRPSMINLTPVRRNFHRSSSACTLPGMAGKDLASILLTKQIEMVADSRSIVNQIKDDRLKLMYKNISRFDQETRLKIFYQYVNARNDSTYKRLVAKSLLRRSTEQESTLRSAEHQLAVKHRSQLMAAQAAAGVVKVEKIRNELQRFVDEGKQLSPVEINNLFKMLARTRSHGISQEISELGLKLKNIIKDERKFLCLMTIATYLSEHKHDFSTYFSFLIAGEANDFSSTEHARAGSETEVMEIYNSVFAWDKNPPAWAFANTRLAASIIGSCSGNNIKSAIEKLYSFAKTARESTEQNQEPIEEICNEALCA